MKVGEPSQSSIPVESLEYLMDREAAATISLRCAAEKTGAESAIAGGRESALALGRRLEAAMRPLSELSFSHLVRNAVARRGGAGIDALTELPNHRSFHEGAVSIRNRCRKLNAPVAVLLADVDGFASLNRAYSHEAGDQVLCWVGRCLRHGCRPTDFVARYDWDQFAVYLPGCTEAEAVKTAERCREAWRLNSRRLALLPQHVPVSVGAASLGAGFLENEHILIRMAAAALSEAKRLGGDRTLGWSAIAPAHLLSAWTPNAAPGGNGSPRTPEDLLRVAHLQSARALAAAVEAKDPYTRDHSMRVSYYAVGLARRLGLPSDEVQMLETAAVLHDVGKIGIPDDILRKPGPLTAEEYELVKRHPATAVAILQHASFFQAELPIILHHHERYDGAGYPAGLAGEAIPPGARLLAVADSIDAMLSPRSYKAGYTKEHVRRELIEFSGRQFDPQVAAVAAEWLAGNPEEFVRDPNAIMDSRVTRR